MALDLLLAAHAAGVGEVAVEGEEDVADEGIDGVVEALDRLVAGGHAVESAVELGQVLGLRYEVKLTQNRGAEGRVSV